MLPKNRHKHGLVGIGQPLLDFTVPLTVERAQRLLQTCNQLRILQGAEFLRKSVEFSKDLFEEFTVGEEIISSPTTDMPTILPGGATLNSLRVAQWLLDGHDATTFIGCIGDDAEGERLLDLIRICGVNPVLRLVHNERTAKCLHISTDDSILHTLDPTIESIKLHNTVDTYQLFYFPGAANKITLSFLKRPEARFAIMSSTYILASLNMAYIPAGSNQKPYSNGDLCGPKLLIYLSKLASSDNRIFCLRLPSSSSSKAGPTDSTVSVKALSAPEWIDVLSNVDILFTDLGSALDVAQTLADWNENDSTQQRVSRPEIRRRFAEFAASVLLSEKRSPGTGKEGSGTNAYASSLYEPMAQSLAATMPGLAERLGFCLANLPKRIGERARIVVIMGSGSASGGVVACTSTGQLYRLSDFVLPGPGYRNAEARPPFKGSQVTSVRIKLSGTVSRPYTGGFRKTGTPEEFLFRGNGTGKCADGFVGGVLAKLMNGSCLADTNNSLSEALLVGSRVAHLLSLDRACSFPKRMPTELRLAMSKVDP
ncbi:hypothetical protein Ciccas_009897 [Cichlidogyrus casuarinus]|uniref:adenosine kinase n=1 Tax=Cichlidogyrus casuarinus TaxID=1844966 RepID=A0ABD2PWQ8_9PLAT